MRIAASVVLCLLLLVTVAVADEYGWHPASVDIGGQHILTFQAGAGHMTAADRRAMLEFRLTKALTHTEYMYPVHMSYLTTPDGIAIAANGVYFVTVTPPDAAANQSTVYQLAREWGERIGHIFELVGPSRQLPHTGAAQPNAPISLD